MDENGRRRCYATKGFMLMQQGRYEANFELAKQHRKFREWMRPKLKALSDGTVVRLHVSGDFFDSTYVRSWQTLVSEFQNLTFYYYTRSWRIEWMQYDLAMLSVMPNVSAWYSADKDMLDVMPTRLPEGIRIAYMQIAPDDIPTRPVDLIFRDYPLRKVTQKQVDGKLVCPHEQGLETSSSITCENCKICTHIEEPVRQGRLALSLI